MKYSQITLAFFSGLALSLANPLFAESKDLVFPPKDNSKVLEYPPVQTQQQNQLGHIPMPNNFSQMPAAPNFPRNPVMYPQQPPMYPMPNNNTFGMPNINMPFNQPFNQNGGFPFGNNSFSGFPNFGNTFNGNNFNPFSSNNMPFGNNSNNAFGMPNNPMNTMFGNNNNSMPFFGNSKKSNRKKAWGDKRNIWPDFYTDFTDEAWDTMSSGPRDLGRMPGGWRFPHISSPDPVTVSDAIVNQFPPIAEEAGNMMDFSDWGIFDNK